METNYAAPKAPRGSGGKSPGRVGAVGTMSTARMPTHEEIAARAKSIWEAKGRPAGRDDENWREAEEQLRQGR